MALLRWLLIGFGALVVLLIALIVGALLFVDTRAIQDFIAEQVEEQTGRQLDFEGDLSLSFFPWLGFELGETRLANAEGFTDDGPMAAIGTTELRVRVLPLLRREVVVDTIILRDLELNLGIDEAGRTNWADIEERFAQLEDDPAEVEEPAPDPDEPTEDPLADLPVDLRVEGFQLSNASINWRDRESDTSANVRGLDLTTGPLELDRETRVSLRVSVETDDGLAADLRADGQARVTLSPMRASLRDLVMEVDARGPDLPDDGVSARLEADIDADLDAGTASIQPLIVTLAETAVGEGHVEATFGDEVPTFDGRFEFARFNPRDLAREFDVDLPEMADETALRTVALGFAFRGNPQEVTVDDVALTFDDTRMDGRLVALLEDVPRINARFDVDAIDLDRYLPEDEEGEGVAAPTEDDPDSEAPDPIAEIPLEAFHAVNADARLNIGRVGYSGLDMTDVAVNILLEDGLLTLSDSGGSVASGRINLDGRFDARGDEPAVAFSTRIEAVQAEPLLEAFLASSPLLGRFDSSLSLDTAGGTLDEWLGALNGDFAAQFGEGVLRGFNVNQVLRNASLRLRGQAEQDIEETRTPFSSLAASGRIRDGVLTTRTFDMEGSGLRGTGGGNVDFGRQQLDFTAAFTVTRQLLGDDVSAEDQLEGLTVPIRFHGDLFSPSVSVDLTSALRARARGEVDAAREELEAEAEEARREAERRLEEERRRQEERLEAERREQQERLQRERDRAREELEQRTRDLLNW